jgi:hypothetical protein
MLDSEFVRSLMRFADPVSRRRTSSTNDHDNHRSPSPVCGTVVPVSNTVGGGAVVAATGGSADSVAGGVAAAATADAPRSAATVVMLRPTTTAATITERVDTANDAGVRFR